MTSGELPLCYHISLSVIRNYIWGTLATRFCCPLCTAQQPLRKTIKLRILTYSMVQSPSWEANWFAASQEVPRISRNPKVHYRTHKLPPPVSILGQAYPVHIPTSHLLEIHRNIIHPPTPRSPQWSLSLQFPHQDKIRYTNINVHMYWQRYGRWIGIKAVMGHSAGRCFG